MFSSISRTFLTGLITLLPVVLTLYLLYWFVVTAESAMGSLINQVLPPEYYWPGMGSAIALVVVFIVGLLMHAYIVQRLFDWIEGLLFHVPLVKSVYRAMRDFFDYFSPGKKKEFEQVVSVSIGNTDMEVSRITLGGYHFLVKGEENGVKLNPDNILITVASQQV